MSQMQTIKAETREATGTGGARAVRRAGKLPAILYGGNEAPQAVSLDPIAVTKAYLQGSFTSSLVNVDVDGKSVQAIPRDVQTDPVRDFVMHVDLMRVGENTRITVEVPVHFLNEEGSPGLKRGGVLNVVRHSVELICPAKSIPAALEVDLDGLDIGSAVKISSMALPEGAQPTIRDRDFTIATIAAPSGLQETGDEDEAGDEEDADTEDAAATEEPSGDDES